MKILPEFCRKPDYVSPIGRPVERFHFKDETTAQLIRARIKSELPKKTGLIPERFHSGAFGWRHWGLRDDYGYFATIEAITPKPL